MATPDQFTYPIDITHNDNNESKIVLITGINGYIASHIALLLLRKGYTVRGTSRSESTPTRLLAQSAFQPFASTSRLQHFVVSEITVPGAFDEAVHGVHAIIHTASPVNFRLRTVDEFFQPAIGGVQSIVQSAYVENRDLGGKIASFVQLSSIAAIADKWRFPPISEGGSENRAYAEDDWNESGEAVARNSEKDGTFLAPVAYGASKAAAERAMWKFVDNASQSDGQWVGPACTSINPGVVTGPPVNWPDSPEKLNETLLPVWNIWSGKCKAEGRLPPQIGGATYIDVRDVAALHVWAMEHPEQSGGQRYLATNGKAPPQGIADTIRKQYAHEDKVVDRIILGEEGRGYATAFGWPGDEPTLKATKAYRALHVESFRGFEESIGDTIEAFRRQWPDLSL
ncbi:hypothetical protein PMZ80_001962 [Knufia obscura]|uniref:NAD-dependent epimerase/dehydratase domain-containing protein n=2 Tax=Knufia TaxID=430999 RepID=A0AAN8I943_9EURO|nr:hypothetical protein PMZ80_001962 [Knufia obscura]KAK5953780.1 hypothetical protein OHC33_005049 [Knufia fluminis]